MVFKKVLKRGLVFIGCFIGFLLLVVGLIFLVNKLSYLYFSYKYDKDVYTYLLKNKELFSNLDTDTVLFTNDNHRDCGWDKRKFVDTLLFRPQVIEILNKTKLKPFYLDFYSDSSDVIGWAVNKDQNTSQKFLKYPCYDLNILTDSYGLIPHYSIQLEESYKVGKAKTIYFTNIEYSLGGLDSVKVEKREIED